MPTESDHGTKRQRLSKLGALLPGRGAAVNCGGSQALIVARFSALLTAAFSVPMS
jgi:hypothetical protein